VSLDVVGAVGVLVSAVPVFVVPLFVVPPFVVPRVSLGAVVWSA
jgi:hypothetical protein